MTMSALEAAYEVLLKAGIPLSLEEITKRVLAERLWHTEGKTPSNTIGASIYTDIKKLDKNSRFEQLGPGTFKLRESLPLPQQDNSPLPAPKQSMTFADSAEKVLNELAHRKPMHYQVITNLALQNNWLNTSGKTPAATMVAQIATEIKQQKNRGELPRFYREATGIYGLSKWKGHDIEYQADRHNQKVRNEILAKIRKLEPSQFEAVVSQLLVKMGFNEVCRTPLSGDGGIDIRGVLKVGDVIQNKLAVQVKRHTQNIQRPDIQKLRGSLNVHEQGLFVTTSDFSKGAIEEATINDKKPIALMNGKKLVTLLVEHEMGIKHKKVILLEREIDFNFEGKEE